MDPLHMAVVLYSNIKHGPYSGCQRRLVYAFGPMSWAAYWPRKGPYGERSNKYIMYKETVLLASRQFERRTPHSIDVYHSKVPRFLGAKEIITTILDKIPWESHTKVVNVEWSSPSPPYTILKVWRNYGRKFTTLWVGWGSGWALTVRITRGCLLRVCESSYKCKCVPRNLSMIVVMMKTRESNCCKPNEQTCEGYKEGLASSLFSHVLQYY